MRAHVSRPWEFLGTMLGDALTGWQSKGVVVVELLRSMISSVGSLLFSLSLRVDLALRRITPSLRS